MGTYLFAGQVLTWLPPLIYTGLNEANVNQQIAIGSLAIWFALGLGALCCMGDFASAMVTAGRGELLKPSSSSSSVSSSSDYPAMSHNPHASATSTTVQ
jgi:hypothetical protein